MTKLDKSKYTKSEIQTLLKERRKQKLLSTPSTKIVLGPHTNKEYGFVIGNGVSRNSINLNNLKQFGKVYAIFLILVKDGVVAQLHYGLQRNMVTKTSIY